MRKSATNTTKARSERSRMALSYANGMEVGVEKGYAHGHSKGFALGLDEGQDLATKKLDREREQNDADIKLANALGQMVEAVSRAVIALSTRKERV